MMFKNLYSQQFLSLHFRRIVLKCRPENNALQICEEDSLQTEFLSLTPPFCFGTKNVILSYY